MREKFTVTESKNAHGAKIVVVRVGGSGQNMLDELTKSDIADKVKLATKENNDFNK